MSNPVGGVTGSISGGGGAKPPKNQLSNNHKPPEPISFTEAEDIVLRAQNTK